MDLPEARELLGVTPADDEKKIRRKYLRAVKKHKPERDPEGFQRVREAYELARVHARYERPQELFVLPESPPSPSSSPQSPPAPASASPPEPAPEPEHDSVDDELFEKRERKLDELDEVTLDLRGDDRLPPLRAALEEDPGCESLREWLFHELLGLERLDEAEELIEAASPRARRWMREELELQKNPTREMKLRKELIGVSAEERVRRLEQALEEQPDSEPLREWLFHELLRDGQDERAAALLDDAGPMLRGYLASQLAFRAPGLVPDEDLSALEEARPYAAVPVLLERGRAEEAIGLVERELVALREGAGVNAGAVLGLILSVCRAGEVDRAVELIDTFEDAVETAGLGILLGQHDALRLLLFTELLDVWDELPADVREALLEGVDRAELTEARDLLASRHGGARGRKILRTLQAEAPSLAALVEDVLPAPRFQPRARGKSPDPTGRGPWWLIVVGVAVVSGLFRMGRACDNDRPTVPSIPSYAPPAIPTAPPTPDVREVLCRVSPNDCDSVRAVGDALAVSDCEAAGREDASLRRVRADLAASNDPDAFGAMVQVQMRLAELERSCYQSGPPP